MKKNNKKKGFTIVELVIVIAVIAILAGVLIPTFSGIVTKANNSADLQEARNLYTEYLAVVNAQPAAVVYVQGGDQYFKVQNSTFATNPVSLGNEAGSVKVTLESNVVTITCLGAHSTTTVGDTCTYCHNTITQ